MYKYNATTEQTSLKAKKFLGDIVCQFLIDYN